MTKPSGAALDDAATKKQADAAGRDSPKRQGDKLGAAVGAAATAGEADEASASGDSPKRQGDPLAHTIEGKRR